tara:strand:+ start:1131 stop:1262 length:132 start_codon:yes stop_codon:yes gene_type:complete
MDNGKGSRKRRLGISQKKYYDNWNKIFQKKKKERPKTNIKRED